jgi:hypothetical protein
LSNEQKPIVPFALSLISGILTLIGGLTVTYLGMWRLELMERVMRYRFVFAAEPRYFPTFMSLTGVLGIAFGVIVIASAVMLYKRPAQHQIWGLLILIFSAFSIFGGMAGFLVGLVLGIVGGALAIAWKSPTTS